MLIQKDLNDQLAALGVVLGTSSKTTQARLSSGLPALDTFLDGGLPRGAITEWGLPLGCGGRQMVLPFLATLSRGQCKHPRSILWIYPETALYVFPPAFAAAGVDLDAIGFVRTDHPVRDLKPALLAGVYAVIIFDFPSSLAKDDLAFLSRQARANGMTVLILRNHWLQEELGNVWARLRLNCRRSQDGAACFEIEVVRGLSPRRGKIDLGSEVGR